MRRTSVSLPTKHIAHDPHEKPDRYETNRSGSLLVKMQSAWASQSQRARYIKTGAIILVVFVLFYCFSPSGVDLYHAGMCCHETRAAGRKRGETTRAQILTTSKNHQAQRARARPRRTKAKRPPTPRTAPTDARGPTPRTSRSSSLSR